MQVKVHFRDDWRYWVRGDEVSLNPNLAKILEKDDIVTILEEKEPHQKNKTKKSFNKPPRDKMLRGGNKKIKIK